MEIVTGAGRVVLSPEVVRELRTRIIDAFVSLPRRGIEIGGVLFGLRQEGSLRIEGFEEAPCEHRFGPSYALSDADRAQLADLLARHRDSDSLPAVGFFRSFTAREPLIEEADEGFVRDHFPEGDFLYLMVQPLSPQTCVASFRFFHDGELLPDMDDAPFDFDPARIGGGAPSAPSSAPEFDRRSSAPPPQTRESPMEARTAHRHDSLAAPPPDSLVANSTRDRRSSAVENGVRARESAIEPIADPPPPRAAQRRSQSAVHNDVAIAHPVPPEPARETPEPRRPESAIELRETADPAPLKPLAGAPQPPAHTDLKLRESEAEPVSPKPARETPELEHPESAIEPRETAAPVLLKPLAGAPQSPTHTDLKLRECEAEPVPPELRRPESAIELRETADPVPLKPWAGAPQPPHTDLKLRESEAEPALPKPARETPELKRPESAIGPRESADPLPPKPSAGAPQRPAHAGLELRESAAEPGALAARVPPEPTSQVTRPIARIEALTAEPAPSLVPGKETESQLPIDALPDVPPPVPNLLKRPGNRAAKGPLSSRPEDQADAHLPGAAPTPVRPPTRIGFPSPKLAPDQPVHAPEALQRKPEPEAPPPVDYGVAPDSDRDWRSAGRGFTTPNESWRVGAAVEDSELPPASLPPAYRARPAAGRPARARWWVSALICLIAGIGSAIVYELWTLAREPRWAALHLDAHRSGTQLEVSWDANAASVGNPSRGLLAIEDGELHREFQLAPAQIRAGKYTYAPAHGDIGLRLILYGNGIGVAGDSLRMASVPNLVETAAASGNPSAGADRVAPPPPPPTPAISDSTPRVVTPPTIVHEVQPGIPDGIRSRIQSEIVIPVEVQVNERGRVTHASANDGGSDGVYRYLAGQAERAAKQWRFTPARAKGGARVAAGKTVYFVFTP